ncbi:MAG: hypothetical protein A2X59_13230 [Nitrospirae bacterium GWC2_42_7]|nr:MAG: hypothetical protein A2X59_13230 [Nitrospirae bacterium GWC2_42_7]
MKKILLFIAFLLIPAISYAQPEITFDYLKFDFGVISQNEKANHLFEFQNTGDQDLIIEKVSAS